MALPKRVETALIKAYFRGLHPDKKPDPKAATWLLNWATKVFVSRLFLTYILDGSMRVRFTRRGKGYRMITRYIGKKRGKA